MLEENVNLSDLIKDEKIKIGSQVVKVPINLPNGDKFNGQTYMIPLDYLYYNDQNGRIGSEISKYESENGIIKTGHNEEYNTAIQNMINDGDDNMEQLVDDIKVKGQEMPGYVLNDGRVVDGNRRFTAKRIMSKGSDAHGIQYFEAVILDGLSVADSNDQALIKQLELRIQFGRLEREDYDPIDKAIDAYKTIIINKYMSESDYATYAGMKKNDITKLINEAELIIEFLKFINADESNYSIAKDMKLDGPLQDMLPQYKKSIKNSDNKEEILSALFSKIIQLRSDDGEDDFKKDFRDIVKKVIGKGKERQYIDQVGDDSANIEMALVTDANGEDSSVVNVDDLYQRINNDDDAMESMTNVVTSSSDILDEIDNEDKKNEPLKLVEEAMKKIDSINIDVFDSISEKDKVKIMNYSRAIKISIEEIMENLG